MVVGDRRKVVSQFSVVTPGENVVDGSDSDEAVADCMDKTSFPRAEYFHLAETDTAGDGMTVSTSMSPSMFLSLLSLFPLLPLTPVLPTA
jgi:hypothetical protein